MNELNLTLVDSVSYDLIIDFEKLVSEMSSEQIAALPDSSILLAAYESLNITLEELEKKGLIH